MVPSTSISLESSALRPIDCRREPGYVLGSLASQRKDGRQCFPIFKGSERFNQDRQLIGRLFNRGTSPKRERPFGDLARLARISVQQCSFGHPGLDEAGLPAVRDDSRLGLVR